MLSHRVVIVYEGQTDRELREALKAKARLPKCIEGPEAAQRFSEALTGKGE